MVEIPTISLNLPLTVDFLPKYQCPAHKRNITSHDVTNSSWLQNGRCLLDVKLALSFFRVERHFCAFECHVTNRTEDFFRLRVKRVVTTGHQHVDKFRYFWKGIQKLCNQFCLRRRLLKQPLLPLHVNGGWPGGMILASREKMLWMPAMSRLLYAAMYFRLISFNADAKSNNE